MVLEGFLQCASFRYLGLTATATGGNDSVTLMETARELSRLPGVLDAAVVMATPANQSILREAGLFVPEVAKATANDLVVVIRAENDDAAGQALSTVETEVG